MLRLILLLDLAYLILLIGIIVLRMARLITARRKTAAGSRLHARLVLVFAGLALVPTVLVALFAGFLGALKDAHPDVLVMDGTRDEGALFGVRPGPLAPGRATLVQGGEITGAVQVAAPYPAGSAL